MKQLFITIVFIGMFLSACSMPPSSEPEQTEAMQLSELGRLLYFDVNLSKNRTQSCATCHDPAKGFIDARDNVTGSAVSLGDDGVSLGDRNAPTAAYAKFSPLFHRNGKGDYIGGQFLDGREADLKGQAGGPPLNLIEMGMFDQQDVMLRLLENKLYVAQFKAIFGKGTFLSADKAYSALKQSIAAFERTAYFSPFDSKYDRYLRGEAELTEQEELGKTLFFSQQFTNCNICHQLNKFQDSEQETFSNYAFHNIGVPSNQRVRALNGLGETYKDIGLAGHPNISGSSEAGKFAGKFKVPTLRNIAVTGPYMHNGVFEDLRTVLLFYNKYNSKSQRRQINPETNEQWQAPEVTQNISLKDLKIGPALDDKRIDALLAFLITLTDQRYESLLN